MSIEEVETEFGVPIPGRILPPEQWTRTAVKRLPLDGPIDFSALFGRTAPLVLDLGCGNGRFTIGSALRRPEIDHFAIDVLPTVIRYATRRGNQRGLANVRFAVKDALGFLRDYVADQTISEIHLYHPQPYHDPRDVGRRLVTPRFLAEVRRALGPGGLFVIQTDHPGYWKYVTQVIPEFFRFEAIEAAWPDAPEGRTRREILARSRGLGVFRGAGIRRDDLTQVDIDRSIRSLPLPTFRSRGEGLELDHLERVGD